MIRIIRPISTLLGVVALLLLNAVVCAARPMSLEGVWRFMIDPTDSGEKNLWFNQNLPVTIRLPDILSGVVLMSRQNHREHEGDIRGYVLQVSDDGRDWREVARGELLSTFAPQQIDFSNTVTARYLKLIALSGFGVDKRTALAELAVITDTPSKKAKPKPLPPRPKP